MKEYEENDAAAMMLAVLPEDCRATYTEDDMIEIIDMIFDYYERTGSLSLDCDGESEEDEILGAVEYVKKMIAKDKGCRVLPGHVETLVRAETEYEQSII